jgi:hypothetical protein
MILKREQGSVFKRQRNQNMWGKAPSELGEQFVLIFHFGFPQSPREAGCSSSYMLYTEIMCTLDYKFSRISSRHGRN